MLISFMLVSFIIRRKRKRKKKKKKRKRKRKKEKRKKKKKKKKRKRKRILPVLSLAESPLSGLNTVSTCETLDICVLKWVRPGGEYVSTSRLKLPSSPPRTNHSIKPMSMGGHVMACLSSACLFRGCLLY